VLLERAIIMVPPARVGIAIATVPAYLLASQLVAGDSAASPPLTPSPLTIIGAASSPSTSSSLNLADSALPGLTQIRRQHCSGVEVQGELECVQTQRHRVDLVLALEGDPALDHVRSEDAAQPSQWVVIVALGAGPTCLSGCAHCLPTGPTFSKPAHLAGGDSIPNAGFS
jgi:hypothetical protein